MRLRTWHVESAVVLLLLSVTASASGGGLAAWLGVVAVQCSFHHMAIGERMREREAARPVPSVECHRQLTAFLVAKEAAWIALFLVTRTYPALVGCVLFLAYPAWRRAWRRVHPITSEAQ